MNTDILLVAGVGVAAAGIGFAAGWYGHRYYEERNYEYFEEPESEEAPDEEETPVLILSEKPDIFEIGKKAYEDYSKQASAYSSDVKKMIKENIFETPEYISIVSKEEAQDLVAEGADTLSATYFVEDDILAGFDDKLDILDELEYELTEGIQALMAGDNDGTVFVHNSNEGIVYELTSSDTSYEEATKEVE